VPQRMIKKVLLISPHGKITITREGSRERKLAVPPLGLAYLAASIRTAGYDVEILDILIEGYDREEEVGNNTFIYGIESDKIRRIIEKSAPDIIGISCIISNRAREVSSICRTAKEALPDIPVVVGGQHPTGAPEMVMNPDIDYLLRGECDHTFVDLIETLNSGNELSAVKGIVFKQDKGFFINPVQDFPDVNSLPRPAWDLLKLEKYWTTGMCDYEIGATGKKKFMIMITSRGCPHKCYFCTSPNMSGRRFRARDVDDVIEEIEKYRSEYGVNRIYFWDDNFFIGRERLKELLDKLARNFSDMTFEVTSGTEANSLDDEIIELLARAGFKKIFLAVESPNEATQKTLIDKNVNIARVPILVKKIKECGMIAEGSFMVGFPDESLERVDTTFEMIKKFGFDRISISIVNPLPGTELYDHCIKNKLFFDDFDPKDIRWSQENIRLEGVPRGYIAQKRRDVWIEYMKNKIDIDVYEKENIKL